MASILSPLALIVPAPNRLTISDAAGPLPMRKQAFPLMRSSSFTPRRALTASAAINSSDLHLLMEEEIAESANFYCILGVSDGATQPEIRQAYKQLVLKYHPDVSPPESAPKSTRIFIRIQEAYETLSDPIARASYDNHFSSTFPFSPHKHYHCHHHPSGEDWKMRWGAQLEELERKSRNKDSRDNKSWAARLRMQRREQSTII